MYNRYLDHSENYTPVMPLPLEPPQNPPAFQPEGEKESLFGLLKPLVEGIHMPKVEIDDLLLLMVVFLLLKESGDEELVLIVAALYLFGK